MVIGAALRSVFVVLLALAVTSPSFAQQGAADVDKAFSIIINTQDDGQVLIDGQAVPQEDLDRRLEAIAAMQPRPDVQILGDRTTGMVQVAKMVAIAQKLGFLKVGFVTRPRE